MKLLSVGDIIWDIYPETECIGGAALNFSAHAVLDGMEVCLLSAVGKDMLGDRALAELARFGVRTDYIQRSEQPTGCCHVTLDAAGVPQFRLARDTAYDNLTLTEAVRTELDDEHFDVLYFGTLIQRTACSIEALSSLLHRLHTPEIFCDVNLRPGCYSPDTVSRCLRHATLLKLSDGEANELLSLFPAHFDACGKNEYEAIARRLAALYPQMKVILVTCGADGSLAYVRQSDSIVRAAAVSVPVVSSVGAGDCYGAAFLAAYLRGESVRGAMQHASARSAYVVSRREAVPLA